MGGGSTLDSVWGWMLGRWLPPGLVAPPHPVRFPPAAGGRDCTWPARGSPQSGASTTFGTQPAGCGARARRARWRRRRLEEGLGARPKDARSSNCCPLAEPGAARRRRRCPGCGTALGSHPPWRQRGPWAAPAPGARGAPWARRPRDAFSAQQLSRRATGAQLSGSCVGKWTSGRGATGACVCRSPLVSFAGWIFQWQAPVSHWRLRARQTLVGQLPEISPRASVP